MDDRVLQDMFEHKIFNIDGISRECYYCTLEDGGAWIWLRILPTDKCRQINFVIRDESQLTDLYSKINNKEIIKEKEFGFISYQN